MARKPFSLLLLRRLSLSSSNAKLSPSLSYLLTTQTRSFSTSSPDTKPSSPLSARLSFVFDQIDAIEKERSEKDETLQRIRAWRESKKAQNPEPEVASGDKESNSAASSAESELVFDSRQRESERSLGVKSEVELVHPWPEWIELMERLVQQNYFDHRRKDEDRMIQESGFDPSQVASADSAGLDFKNYKLVQTACINFGKDRFDILRSLSRQDIQILVGFGCPSADKKVVFSSKLLRKHVHLDEGDVCSSCSLRNSCERAYLLTFKEEEARTIDIMRVLLAYGFDPNGVANESLLKRKSVKTVVRKLLHQVVKLSSVPIDPNLPPPVIKKPPPKVKQPPPPPRKRVGRDDIEMKKGDWLCPKCDFMNFAKNAVCLQCDAKRPKRQLLPGEWECPQCNFLNYRRNTACFHCDCKRPPDEFVENKMQDNLHGPRMKMDKAATRSEVSNAWNFDFDDNESDGADVAAFEYADSSVMEEGSPLDNQAHGGDSGRPEYDFNKASRLPGARDEEHSNAYSSRPGIGFDDFDDEEDDDIDSYELVTSNKNSAHKASSNDFSDFEGLSGSEDIEHSDNKLHSRHRTPPRSSNKQSKPMRKRVSFSGSDDDDLDSDPEKELSSHPKWKSSHVADSRPRGRGSRGPSKALSFGSDDELGLSDTDDDLDENFGQGRGKANNFRSRRSFDVEDDPFAGSDSDSNSSRPRGNKFRGKDESNRKGNNLKGRHSNYNFTQDTEFRSNGTKNGRRNSFKDDDSDGYVSDRRFRGNKGGDVHNFKGPRREGFGKLQRQRNEYDRDTHNFKGPRREGFGKLQGQRNEYDRDTHNFKGPRRDTFGKQRDGRRGNEYGRDTNNFKGPRREGFGKQRDDFGRDKDKDFGEFKNSRRVIER
ncbi:hypothetical protein UlMin_029228 [Ulmus minor]